MKLSIKRQSPLLLFFTIMLLEIFLGGAGRLTTFGPLTLRMYLFIAGIGLFFLLLLSGRKLSRTTLVLMGCFLVVFVIAILQGLMFGDSHANLFADVKMVSFFFILPFFDMMINSYTDYVRVVKLIKWTSLFLAIAYLVFFVFLNSHIVPFLTIYRAMSKPEYFAEFGFRGEIAVIYKGFIYACIGYFFYFFNERSSRNTIKILILFAAVALTLARSYLLILTFLTLSYVLYKFLVSRKNRVLNMIVIGLVIIGAIAVVPILLEALGDKSVSDSIRIVQIQQVFERINPLSIFIGHGFGIGVPIRPVHMEITYLEIFHKQGILGLAFWFLIPIYIGLKYYNYRIYRKQNSEMNLIDARPFLFGVCFLYLQSLFNPYLTNSMGMTFLFISLIVFEKLKKFNEEKNLGLHGDL